MYVIELELAISKRGHSTQNLTAFLYSWSDLWLCVVHSQISQFKIKKPETLLQSLKQPWWIEMVG